MSSALPPHVDGAYTSDRIYGMVVFGSSGDLASFLTSLFLSMKTIVTPEYLSFDGVWFRTKAGK
jgi:hypothetical protein